MASTLEDKIKEYKKIVVIEDKAKAKLDALKKEFEEKSNKRKGLEDEIKVLAEAQKAELFPKKQNLEILGCKLGYTKSESIVINESTTLQKIKEVYEESNRFIKIKESVDTKALNALTDDELKSIDAKRKSEEKYYVKVI